MDITEEQTHLDKIQDTVLQEEEEEEEEEEDKTKLASPFGRKSARLRD